jgi:hypothetical protein
MSVPSTLEEDYDMSDFDELEKIYGDFDVPDDVVDAASGNMGLLVDTYFGSSSQKSRNLLSVFIVLSILRNLLLTPLTRDMYTQIFNGYTDDIRQFIDLITSIIELKPEYIVFNDDVRIMLNWTLRRTPGNIELINGEAFMNIISPRIGGSKRKQKSKKSKKSRRSQKKRKVIRKTKKHRIIKRK